MIKPLSLALLPITAALALKAQEANPVPDKSGYNLFQPVPEKWMREFSPDRPDKTESPYTVDAGHFQLETDFANYTDTKQSGEHTKAWQVGDFNLKAGLLNNVDIQLAYDSYLNVQTKARTGESTRVSGWGNLTARLKVNLWGDDGGTTAFALLPYVKFPTSTGNLGNNAVEGGMILPLAVKLPWDFDLGCETAVGVWQNTADDNYHEDFIHSVTVDHQLIEKLSGYVEFFSDLSTERHAGWIATVDIGLEFLVTENMQLDCGCNFGITRAADDYNPFAGITVRF